MVINKPYLLFLGDASDQLAAKTAEGLAYWRRSDCVGQMRLPGCNADLHLRGLPEYPLPSLESCIAANEAAARLTNPNATCIGISLNTSALGEAEARDLLEETETRIGLPCVDAVRTGMARLVDCLPI